VAPEPEAAGSICPKDGMVECGGCGIYYYGVGFIIIIIIGIKN
jgi:hypothetical protein